MEGGGGPLETMRGTTAEVEHRRSFQRKCRGALRNTTGLEDGIAQMEKKLREAGKALWRVTLGWRRIEAKEGRRMLPGVTSLGWRHLEPEAPRRRSDVSRVDVDCKGTLGDRNVVSSAGAAQKKGKAVTRKESASWASFRVRCAIRLGGANVSISPTRARRGATKRASSFMTLQPSWRKRMACRTRSTSAETVVVAG